MIELKSFGGVILSNGNGKETISADLPTYEATTIVVRGKHIATGNKHSRPFQVELYWIAASAAGLQVYWDELAALVGTSGTVVGAAANGTQKNCTGILMGVSNLKIQTAGDVTATITVEIMPTSGWLGGGI